MNKEKTPSTDNLHHYFVGFTKSNPDIKHSLNNNDWQALAKDALKKRKLKVAERILEDMSINDITAIANGDIDLNEVIEKASISHQRIEK